MDGLSPRHAADGQAAGTYRHCCRYGQYRLTAGHGHLSLAGRVYPDSISDTHSHHKVIVCVTETSTIDAADAARAGRHTSPLRRQPLTSQQHQLKQFLRSDYVQGIFERIAAEPTERFSAARPDYTVTVSYLPQASSAGGCGLAQEAPKHHSRQGPSSRRRSSTQLRPCDFSVSAVTKAARYQIVRLQEQFPRCRLSGQHSAKLPPLAVS